MWHPVKEIPPLGKTEAVPSQYIGRGDPSCTIELFESPLLLAFVPLDVGYSYKLAYLRVVNETFEDGHKYQGIEWVAAGQEALRIFPSHWTEIPTPPEPEPEPESKLVVPSNELILPEGVA